MVQTVWIAFILGCWSSLYLLDAFLKSQPWSSVRYVRFLERTGFSMSVCQLRWYSTSMNRTFVRLAQWRPKILKAWFTCGVFFGLVAMLLSVFLLTLMVFNTLTKNNVETQVLTPVMPGVNLPASQISYYLLTLLVCGILHEIGHAIAAVREQVRVNGFGLFLLLIYPGAYVDLSTEHLQIISPLRQLRIYCAGVWHNFIIVLVAIVVLFSYPWVIMPFYTTGNGVVVTHVTKNTAVSGPRGLALRDPITSVGGCEVTNIQTWNQCIAQSIREPSCGNCLPNTAVSGPQGLALRDPITSMGGCEVTNIQTWNQCIAQSIREPACGNCLPNMVVSGPRGLALRDPITSMGGCEVTNIQTWNQCIAQSIREPSCGNCLPNTAVSGPRGLALRDPITSVGGCEVTNIQTWNQCIAQSIREPSCGNCLPVSMINELDTSNKRRLETASPYIDCCNETSSTHLCFMYHTKHNPNNNYACLPARATTDRPMCKYQSDCYSPNTEMSCVYPSIDNQTKLLRVVHGHKPPLLFLGHPLDLHYSVVLSNYIPNNLFVPLNLPYFIDTFSKYLISLSGALVILNVVPCYALDGQWICQGFIELSLRSSIPDKEVRGAIYSLIILFGTLLLFINVILAMWTLFIS